MPVAKTVHILHYFGKEKALEIVLEATRELRAKMIKDDPKEKEGISEIGKQLQELFVSFGPSGMRWMQVFSILLKEDLMVKMVENPIPLILMSLVIPIRDENSHQYPIGEPVLIVLGDDVSSVRASMANGIIGRNLGVNENAVKVATDEDVIRYVNDVFKDFVMGGGEV